MSHSQCPHAWDWGQNMAKQVCSEAASWVGTSTANKLQGPIQQLHSQSAAGMGGKELSLLHKCTKVFLSASANSHWGGSAGTSGGFVLCTDCCSDWAPSAINQPSQQGSSQTKAITVSKLERPSRMLAGICLFLVWRCCCLLAGP